MTREMRMGIIGVDRVASLLAVILLAATSPIVSQEITGPVVSGGDGSVCRYSMFIFKPVSSSSGRNSEEFYQLSEELHENMMQFCDMFKPGQVLQGLGAMCHTKLTSNSSFPSIAVQLTGCCEGSAAVTLSEAFGDRLLGCRSVGLGQEPLSLDVKIVQGEDTDEDTEEAVAEETGDYEETVTEADARSVEPTLLTEIEDSTGQVADEGSNEGFPDWRFWVILALSLLIMLLLLLLCVFCLCIHSQKKKLKDMQVNDSSRQTSIDDGSLPLSPPVLYTNDSRKSIVPIEDYDKHEYETDGSRQREIVALDEDYDSHRSLVAVDEARSTDPSPADDADANVFSNFGNEQQGSDFRSSKQEHGIQDMVAIDIDDSHGERQLVVADIEDNGHHADGKLTNYDMMASEYGSSEDPVPADSNGFGDSSQQQRPPAPSAYRMSRFGRMAKAEQNPLQEDED